MLYTFHDAWLSWNENIPFSIGFLGDSTFAGVNTSSWNEEMNDTCTVQAFPHLLENKLLNEFGNNSPKIINCGFSGDNCQLSLNRLPLLLEKQLSDTKMIGVGLGINDRIQYHSLLEYHTRFKIDFEKIIVEILNAGKTPFILTCQATIEMGVHTEYIKKYPLRTTSNITIITNQIKKELARKYDLMLIDLNKFTENFLLYSQYATKDLISDQLHLGDIGHQLVADYLFSIMSPYTIRLSKQKKISYLTQLVRTDIPQDLFFMNTNKPFDYYFDLNNLAESTLLFKSTLYNDTNSQIELNFHQPNLPNYQLLVKVNDQPFLMDQPLLKIGQLDIGLLDIEIFPIASFSSSFFGITVTS